MTVGRGNHNINNGAAGGGNWTIIEKLGNSVTVARMTLDHLVKVRILVPQSFFRLKRKKDRAIENRKLKIDEKSFRLRSNFDSRIS